LVVLCEYGERAAHLAWNAERHKLGSPYRARQRRFRGGIDTRVSQALRAGRAQWQRLTNRRGLAQRVTRRASICRGRAQQL